MPKILITRLSSFGDVAMLVPAVYSVAARYPQERFVVLTRKAFAPLFENLGFNVSVRVFDPRKHGGALGVIRLINSLSMSGYSAMADMHDVLRTKVIRASFYLQGKRVAYIDKGRDDKSRMIEDKILEPALTPTINRYMEVFAKIGYPAEMTFTNFFEFRERSLYLIRSVVPGEKKGKWIGIAPLAKHKEKMYPIENMRNIILSLAANSEYTIFLFGLNDEVRLSIRPYINKYRNIIDISSRLNLESEMLLISYLDVMVSMDSANMHLASLVQVPVVSVWGATHPSLGFYGHKQNTENAIQVDLNCRPCSVFGDVPCHRGDYACMTMIHESQIVSQVEKILAQK